MKPIRFGAATIYTRISPENWIKTAQRIEELGYSPRFLVSPDNPDRFRLDVKYFLFLADVLSPGFFLVTPLSLGLFSP